MSLSALSIAQNRPKTKDLSFERSAVIEESVGAATGRGLDPEDNTVSEAEKLLARAGEAASSAGQRVAADAHSLHTSSANATDLELITAFQNGDERAFAKLFKRREADIYTFCLRMTSGDPDLAADAFQETFIKVYEKAHQFRSGTNVMGWLLMIARNTSLNLLRGIRQIDKLDDHLSLESRDRSLSPEFPQEQQFFRDILEEAIHSLPIEIREPFMLREFEDFSYTDISDQLGITLGATKQRIYRAKQMMREKLAPYFTDGSTGGPTRVQYGSSTIFSNTEDEQ